MNKRTVGTRYEDAASAYLSRIGYRILARNYRIRSGEIDIIAWDGKADGLQPGTEPELVFIEVKYRRGSLYGPGQAHVDKRKQQKIIQTAQYYLMQQNRTDICCRFDVIAIDGSGQIEHIRNAFEK